MTFAWAGPKLPELKTRVTDLAQILPAPDEARIEADLGAYEQATGHQFALVTMASLEGAAIEDFSIRLAEAWRLGDKARDDGLLLLIVPSEKRVRIEVGYGLEGVITDAVAARTIRNQIAPAFREGNYVRGVESALADLKARAQGEATGVAGPRTKSQGERLITGLLRLLPIGIFLLLFFLGGGGGRGGRRRSGIGPVWVGGGYGGFSGRSGGSGGGFGGGGGGFGGGGASGSW